jgi:hypothetical protein
MSHMIALCAEISRSCNKNSSNHNQDDIFNVTKAAANKSTLMQTTKAKAANTSR